MAGFLKIEDLGVSYFRLVLDTAGQVKTLDEVFDLIYSGGTYVSRINEIRDLVLQGNIDRANKLKVQLPSVIFSCQTDGKGRKEQNISQLHPLICLDIDAKDNPDIDLIYDTKHQIIKEPSVVACFISPSGLGLKVLIRTEHTQILSTSNLNLNASVLQSALQRFKQSNSALVEYFKLNYGLKLDPHSASPVALNFISYDPDLFLNWDAEPFDVNQVLDLGSGVRSKIWSKNKGSAISPTPPSKNNFTKKLVFNKRVDISNKVDSYEDWYRVGLGLATEYGEAGRELFHYISKHSKGYDQHECDRRYDQLLRDNRGQVGLGTVKHILTQNTIEGEGTAFNDTKPQVSISVEDYLDKFGFLNFRKKVRSSFYSFNFVRFLVIAKEHLHLFSCKIGSIIKPLWIKDNKVHILEKTDILQVILDYLEASIEEESFVIEDVNKEFVINREDLMNSVFHWRSDILSDNTISSLPSFSLSANVLFSKAQISYKFYNNGVLCIDGINATTELKSYEYFAKQGKYVFEHEILGRDYIPGEAENSEIAQFVENISGTSERVQWCRLLLGYLSHNYTIDLKKKAVIFSDSQSIGGQESGRTGKGLLGEIVRYQYERVNSNEENKSVTFVDGKNFNIDNKFKYQNCTANTRLILLEDIKTNHNVQQHFNELLVGFNIERKNSQPFKINAKLVLTTNYSIPLEGTSSRSRFWEFSLLPYYSDVFTPDQEFGGFFFSEDWSQSQWANYDAFMHKCIMQYFNALAKSNGNIMQLEDEVNVIKKLEDLVGIEFLDFADNLVNADGTIGIQDGTKYYRKDLYSSFCNFFPRTKVSAKMFLHKIRQFKKYHPDWEEDKVDRNNNRMQEGQDSIGRYIIFVKKDQASA